MAQRISKIGPLSAAKIAAVLYGLMGLIFIPFMLIMSQVAPSDTEFPGFGVGFTLILPIAYACIGFVFTFIGAALYNLVAGWVGGVEIDLA